MTWDKVQPGRHPLARAGIVGNPYHGLAQGGVITLPNAAVKTYPQPDGTWPDQAGATHLLMRPGQPAVERTAEELAADAAAGWQWRNVAMLSGGRQQLYGRELDGWIYVDPEGGRWLMQFATDLEAASYPTDSDLSMTLNVKRFGVFGAEPQSLSFTLSMSAWGQQGYAALQDFPTGGAPVNVTAVNLVLDAITPNGSRAALCVHRRRTTSAVAYDTTLDVAVRHALGWLEVSVTMVDGLPSPSLSVLKTRAQTLMIEERTVVNSPVTEELPPLLSPGVPAEIGVGTFTFAFESLRLVSAWVNPDTGDWRWVALRYRHAGQNVAAVETAGLTYTAHGEIDFENWMALEVDGVEQVRLDCSLHTTVDRTITYYDDGGFGRAEVGLLPAASSVTIDGVEYDQLSAGEDPEPVEGGVVTVDVQGNPGGFYAGADSDFMPRIFQMQWREQLRTILSPPEPYQVAVDICHQSPQVIGMRMHVLSGAVDEFTYWPRVTPGGLVGEKVTRPYAAGERMYGSWCPHTGLVVSMQGSPVCWV